MMLMFLFLRMGSIFIVENRFFSGFVVGFESKPNLKFGFFFWVPFYYLFDMHDTGCC